MTKWAFLAFPLIGVALLASCAPSATVERSGTVLTISGDITDEVTMRVRGAGLDGIDTIRISSNAGSESAAIALAELIEEKGLNLIVQGECLGPCGQYVFIAARIETIESSAVVGCGENILAAAEIGEDAYGSPLSISERERLTRARNLYRRRGVSEGFALNCLNQIAPTCAATFQQDGVTRRALNLTEDAWIPLAEHFEQFGIGSVRGAPSSDADARRVMQLRPGTRWNSAAPLPQAFLESEIPSTARRCSARTGRAALKPI